VDYHDAAYRWAERKQLVTHERTGAMQFVKIPVVTAEAPGFAATVEPAVAPRPPFAGLSWPVTRPRKQRVLLSIWRPAYVACTRPRDRLMIGAIKPGSGF
jgi:hypothetical protein